MNLTPRQSEIVRLRCERNLARKEIAQVLGITESTVRNHLWEVHKRTGMAGFALCDWWGYERGRLSAVPAMRAEVT